MRLNNINMLIIPVLIILVVLSFVFNPGAAFIVSGIYTLLYTCLSVQVDLPTDTFEVWEYLFSKKEK